MSGAYTAKAAADTSPVVPPGWNPAWPFPGVYPPGYGPVLTLVMTATDSIAFGGAATVTGSLRDQDTYATQEPADTATIWTASIEGTTVNLRFEGDPEYSSSISSDCTFGTYWDSTGEIEFELTEVNQGDTVVLTGTSIVAGDSVSNTENIEISVAIAKAVLTFTMTSSDQGKILWIAEAVVRNLSGTPNTSATARVEMNKNTPNTKFIVNGENDSTALGEVTIGPYIDYIGSGDNTDVGSITWSESGSITLTILEDGSFYVRLQVHTAGVNDSVIVANMKFYDSENNLLSNHDATATVNVSSSVHWLEFNTATGEVTEIVIS